MGRYRRLHFFLNFLINRFSSKMHVNNDVWSLRSFDNLMQPNLDKDSAELRHLISWSSEMMCYY